MNKKITIIISITVIVLLAIILPLSLSNNWKIDMDSLEKSLLKEFSELNLRKLEREDILGYFGLDITSDVEALFLTDFNNANEPFNPNTLIIIIKDKDYSQYLDTLKDYLNVEIQNAVDTERLELYQNAIIKTKDNYFYLVLGNDKNIVKAIDILLNDK